MFLYILILLVIVIILSYTGQNTKSSEKLEENERPSAFNYFLTVFVAFIIVVLGYISINTIRTMLIEYKNGEVNYRRCIHSEYNLEGYTTCNEFEDRSVTLENRIKDHINSSFIWGVISSGFVAYLKFKDYKKKIHV